MVYLCGALLLAGQQVYYVIVEGATPFYAGLFLSTGMALSGMPRPCRTLDDGQLALAGHALVDW